MIAFSDEEIITGIQNNECTVIEYIYRSYYFEVRDWVSKSLSYHNNEIKDIFQDAMVAVFLNITKPGFKLKSSFKTYLFSIVRNLLLVEFKIKTKNKLVDINENSVLKEMYHSNEFLNELPTEFELVHEMKHGLFWQKFKTLAEDCKKILLMTISETNLNEMAVTLGFKSGNYVKKRRHFCKEYLKKKIKEDYQYKLIKEYEDNT